MAVPSSQLPASISQFPGDISSLALLLRCPVSGQSLTLASSDELERLRAITAIPLENALIRADHLLAYPVSNGIPSLLPTDGIAISDL